MEGKEGKAPQESLILRAHTHSTHTGVIESRGKKDIKATKWIHAWGEVAVSVG